MNSTKYKSALVWGLAAIVILSLGVSLPDLPKLTFTAADREITVQFPQLPSRFFLWGRPIQLKPDYVLDLNYQSGEFFLFELDSPAEGKVEEDYQGRYVILANQVEKRVNHFYSKPAAAYLHQQEDRQLLVVETAHQARKDIISAMAIQPAKLVFYVQNEEIDENELIFSDDWLESFQEIGVDNSNIDRAVGRIDFQTNQPMVALHLDEEGRSNLFTATRENRDQLLAAAIDGSLVLLTPIVQPIHEGRISISGGMSREQAELIAAVIQFPIQESVELIDENDELKVDFQQLSTIEPISIFGSQIFPLDLHLMSGIFVFTFISIVSLFLFKRKGLTLVLFLWSTIIINAAFFRISQFVVSWPTLIAFFVTILYWWTAASVLLLNSFCLAKSEQISKKEALFRIYSFKNKSVIKIASLLLFSSLLLTGISNSRFLHERFSGDFSQTLFQLSLLIISLSSLYVVIVRDFLTDNELNQ